MPNFLEFNNNSLNFKYDFKFKLHGIRICTDSWLKGQGSWKPPRNGKWTARCSFGNLTHTQQLCRPINGWQTYSCYSNQTGFEKYTSDSCSSLSDEGRQNWQNEKIYTWDPNQFWEVRKWLGCEYKQNVRWNLQERNNLLESRFY